MNIDINSLISLVNAQIERDAFRAGVMTLGGLRKALASADASLPVVTSGGVSLGQLDSYRGYYDRLAFEPTSQPATVGVIIACLDEAEGETFRGYKGGDYLMDSHTFMHVAGYGDCGPAIVGVRIEADHVLVETSDEEA